MVRGDADRDRDREQEQHLPARVQPERAAVAELEPVVEEADRAAGERRAEDRQRRQRVVARREERDRRREHDQQAAHRRRALLGRVVLRALLADVLAELVPAQEVDERRAGEDRDDQRDERRDEDACHYAVSFAATASSPTAREPFTSTTSPGRSERRERVGGLVRGREPARGRRSPLDVAARERPDRDRARRRRLAATASPTSRWYAGASAPSSAISPSTATRRRGPARSARCSSAARIESGFAL